MSPSPLRVTVWNEFINERVLPDVGAVYPRGIHHVLREALEEQLGAGVQVHTATLDEPEHGLSQQRLDETDVLTWWGHSAHDQVQTEVVERVLHRVWQGMGLVVLHSGHLSRIFRRLMGTSCTLRWREAGERERLWVVAPSHPIAAGLSQEYFELPQVETYGEHVDIPAPEDLIFISWFSGGEVFRSGCTFRRGNGKIFYFRPGHETHPIYYHPQVRRVIANGVGWAAPNPGPYRGRSLHAPDPLV